ncbi:hypothetical protein O8W32_01160 [Methanomassiliicoccales archaeon LGM-DZ1]|nr:hypothetical protein O8W32_01160 [Methanomassiliicoccales archaeon LGM-DZ1]
MYPTGRNAYPSRSPFFRRTSAMWTKSRTVSTAAAARAMAASLYLILPATTHCPLILGMISSNAADPSPQIIAGTTPVALKYIRLYMDPIPAL